MSLSRRALLWSGLGASGALVLGWTLLPPRERLGRADTLPAAVGEVGLNGWLRIAADGGAVLAMPYAEMGQGVHTALQMMVAEELALPLDRVALTEAGDETLYGNVAVVEASLATHPRHSGPGRDGPSLRLGRWMLRKVGRELGIVITGGSSSMADAFEVVRWAAATARAQLLGAASLQWKLPVAELTLADGVISHASDQRAHYGELARAAALTPPGEVRLTPRAQWAVLGRSQPRTDALDKSRGRATYGIDVRLPGLLFAVVRHAPTLGGAPGRFDADATLRRPGVERVVRLGAEAGSTDALAVVARGTWQAMQAARQMVVEWQGRPAGALDSALIERQLEHAARAAAREAGGAVFHQQGDAAVALAHSARRLEALYRAPYLAHATMEPMNCTARVSADGREVEVWAPTQVPGLARAVAARVAGVAASQVRLHMTLMGGGFGRRLEVDHVAQAVRVAMDTGGRPVQLLWPREEDFSHDVYRPAGAALLQGGLDSSGRLLALAIHSAGDAVAPRWAERNAPLLVGPDGMDKTTSEGLFDLPYAIAHQRIAHVATRSGVPVGNWRSVGHSHNAFFSEGFIDELAHAAGADPLAFRLRLLADMPRHAAVLSLAAERAGWGRPPPAGRARGLALHESFGSIVAMVMEVSLADGRPRVHRVVCAADCGTVIHPDGVAQQVEGSVVFGLTAALHGRIDIVGGAVVQKNFPDQPLMALRDTPAIETHLVASEAPPTGMGEPAVPPVAPALANALFALTGQRPRDLPLRLG